MNCPKCGTKMKTTHVYNGGDAGKVRRLECLKCRTVATTQEMIVAINPVQGQGAYMLAKKK